MADIANPGFQRAASEFLGRFGLRAGPSPGTAALKELYSAFSRLPYENVSKIISFRDSGGAPSPEKALRDETRVIEGFLEHRLGGTCFSLTNALACLLETCGFDCYRVLGDMRHGKNIHCAVVVRLGAEKYLCDSGYLLPEPLVLKPGGKSTLYGQLYTYLLQADSPGRRSREKTYSLHTVSPGQQQARWRYRITDRPVGRELFTHYWKLTFSAPMNRHLLLTRNSEQGQIYIHKHKLRLTGSRGHRNSNIRLCAPERIEELFEIDRAMAAQALELIEAERRTEASSQPE
ncbi:MAG: arylamine N-acetyltransferase [Gemmatimonadota bacterium]|nr:arylamine N-acetyltransferase [Gemmatimonadota bacterium]